jgi:hypothetical protein
LEELAALIDGRLPTAEAARVRAHLASCEDCYEVFAETLHLQEELRGEEEAKRDVAAYPFEKRRKVRPWWAAAVAAVLVAGVGIGLWYTRGAVSDFSVADLAKPLAGKITEPAKVAWSETLRGGAGDKETATEKLSVQTGVALFNLQFALDSNDSEAAKAAAAQVCNVLGISGERNSRDGAPVSSQIPLSDPAIRTFYSELPEGLIKEAPKNFSQEAEEMAEALRQSGYFEDEQAYFDLGTWTEAGRYAAIAKVQMPASFQSGKAAYLHEQLQKNKEKDKDADLPAEVLTVLKTIQKLPADDYAALKTQFEKILSYYYPQGHSYDESPATGNPSPEPGTSPPVP